MNNKDKVVPMSNVLQKCKDDWIVVRNMYNLAEDDIDVGSRITSTQYKIDNVKDLEHEWLRQGNLVEGHLTPHGKFYITAVVTKYIRK